LSQFFGAKAAEFVDICHGIICVVTGGHEYEHEHGWLFPQDGCEFVTVGKIRSLSNTEKLKSFKEESWFSALMHGKKPHFWGCQDLSCEKLFGTRRSVTLVILL
jgi:hypothetical protein